jgi:SNF2 family DNA or RNA helicase
MKRLTALLDKSSLYADFLAKRMESQAEQQKKKDAKAEKRAENAKLKAAAAASVVAPVVDRSTRGGGGGGPAASTTSTTATKRRKSPGKKGKAAMEQEAEDVQEEKEEVLAAGTHSKRRRVNDEGEAAAADAGGGAAEADDEDGPIQPALFTGGELRNYQLAGMEWMAALYENGLNGILADEMGLGKTAQCIALVAHLYAMKVPGPYLVVGPLSTLPNWQNEFERFTPDIPVILYHGSPEDRAEKRSHIMKKAKGAVGLPVRRPSVCRTTDRGVGVVAFNLQVLLFLCTEDGKEITPAVPPPLGLTATPQSTQLWTKYSLGRPPPPPTHTPSFPLIPIHLYTTRVCATGGHHIVRDYYQGCKGSAEGPVEVYSGG